jgi:hypothetical protein
MITPKTDADLLACYREMVLNLMGRLDPYGLPLTPDEQATFIRSALWQAKTIHDSEPFLRGRVVETLDKAVALNRPKTKSS